MATEHGCLSVEDVAALLLPATRAPEVHLARVHLEACSSCREVVAAAAHGVEGSVEAKADREPPSSMEASGGTPFDPVESFPVGGLLDGRYRIEKLLGAGAMGLVFAARHEASLSRVAIKVLRAPSKSVASRFLREARIGAMLEGDAGFVRIFDVGALPSGEPFIVMEELEGEDLGARLAAGPLSSAQAAGLFIKICATLAKAHARGVIHRDIKPANIFLVAAPDGGEERPKVLDFGISKLTTPADAPAVTSTQHGMLIGTPAYMAPEQLRGRRDVDARIDVWSLGVVLFQSLTGKLPFASSNLASLAIAVASEAHPRPRAVRPDLPPAWDAIIDRCLAKAPSKRFPSVAALAGALRPLASSHRATGAAAPERRVSRAGIAAALAAGCAVFALVWLASAPWPRGGGPPAAAPAPSSAPRASGPTSSGSVDSALSTDGRPAGAPPPPTPSAVEAEAFEPRTSGRKGRAVLSVSASPRPARASLRQDRTAIPARPAASNSAPERPGPLDTPD